MPSAQGYQSITPHLPFATPQPAAPIPQYAGARPTPSYQQPIIHQAPVGYKAPQPVEVYILNDHANASIPPEIREQFQRDEHGRVLFFTAPPINVEPVVHRPGRALGHSAQYLADKAKRDAKIAAKRKAEAANAAEREEAAKKARIEAEAKFKKQVNELGTKAMKALENQLAYAVKKEYESLFDGKDVQGGIAKQLDALADVQQKTAEKNHEREIRERQQKTKERTTVTGMTVNLEEKA